MVLKNYYHMLFSALNVFISKYNNTILTVLVVDFGWPDSLESNSTTFQYFTFVS